MSSTIISDKNVRQAFEDLVQELSDHPKIRVAESHLAKPAHPRLLEGVRAANGGTLPEAVESFYAQMNGFKLRWYITDMDLLRRFYDDPSLHEPEDYDATGSSEILPIEHVFRRREPWKLGGDPLEGLIAPFDQFTPEASYAFCPAPVRDGRVWVSDPGEPEVCEPTAHDFEVFLDLYLHARAIRYFGKTLIDASSQSVESKSFLRTAAELFSDFDPARYEPHPSGPTLTKLAGDIGVTPTDLDQEYANFPEGLFILLQKAHWDR
jgi:hypothetical protein